MRMAKLIVLVACVVIAGPAAANVTDASTKATKAAAITVMMTDLGCTALSTDTFEARSWSWGASQLISELNGAGKAVLDGLVLTRMTDACSPALLRGVLTGLHNKELRLSQYDTNGTLKATVSMVDVVLTDWKIAGANTSGEATEQVTLSASRFTFTDVASGANFCYDIQKQVRC